MFPGSRARRRTGSLLHAFLVRTRKRKKLDLGELGSCHTVKLTCIFQSTSLEHGGHRVPCEERFNIAISCLACSLCNPQFARRFLHVPLWWIYPTATVLYSSTFGTLGKRRFTLYVPPCHYLIGFTTIASGYCVKKICAYQGSAWQSAWQSTS